LTTTLTYNASGFISTITDPADRETTFTVGTDGNLTAVEDPNGSTTDYGYSTPSNHLATSETDPDGNTATAHYNSFGQLTSETLFGDTGTTSIDAALSNGLLAPGDSGTLSTTYAGSVTDPDGRTTTVTFNWMSHPTGEEEANGGSTSTTYDNAGFPVSETDALGRTVDYTYDADGDVTSITEANISGSGGLGGSGGSGGGSGATETITYDQFGVPTSIKDFDGNTTTYVLDDHGNVLEEEQPGGVDEEWTYNSAGQVLTATDGNGATTTYTYNDLGRLTEIQEPGTGSPTIKYGYDTAGDVTSVTDEVGDTVTYTYNSMGEVLTEQNPVQAAAGKDVSFTYDGDGNLLTETDADGNTVTYAYNARNEDVSMTDALDRTTEYGYDADGNLITITDPTGGTMTYTYTTENEVATVTDPTGGTTTYGYDLDGELTSLTDPNGFETTFAYDDLGLLVGQSEDTKVSEGSGSLLMLESVATYTYNQDGDELTASDGDDHKTTYTYNALNELTEVENGDSDTTDYTYDDDGNVLTVTDGLGHTTSYTYNDMNQVLTETQPSGGGTTSYDYDEAGRLISLTDPDDNLTTYAYNGANEVVTEESPTGGLTTMTYNLDGDVLSTIDPDGHEITYAYDADNEMTGETWVNPAGGTPIDVFHFTYNSDGELTAVSDDNSAYQYAYNADGEETSQADVGSPDLPSVTLTYDYDADGNRTAMDDSLGGLVSYAYNARDELTNETLSGTDISAIAVANTYDNAGNMTGQTRYSNTAETDVVATTSYTYDDANQMTGITDKNSSGTTLVSYGYTFNAAGLVSQETRTWDSGADTDTLGYTYTNNDQLTGVTHTNDAFANESFTYDANGNETGTGYTTSTGNEQTASPGNTYTYDADGNMITDTITSTGDVWTYAYNFRGQMTGAVEKTSGGTVLAQVSYTYDALGNRIGMDENGAETWTLYDGSDPIMDFNSSGSLEMRYLNGPTGQLVDSVLARESSSGTVAWYLPDRLGTVRDLINNSGAIIDHIDFSAFGTVLDQSDASEGDRMMGFAGMELDSVTGMNLAVYRVQDPGTGRWTSQDPMGFAAGNPDLYGYADNAPVDLVDPSGDEPYGGITTTLDGNTLTINITIWVLDDGNLTDELLGRVKDGIQKAWTGTTSNGCQIKTNVTLKKVQRKNGEENGKPRPPAVRFGAPRSRSHVYCPSCNDPFTWSGDWRNDAPPEVYGFEAGHLFGFKDQFKEGTDEPFDGFGDTIMAKPGNPASGKITAGPLKGKSYLDLLYERFCTNPPTNPAGPPAEHP
jgi:RHS repeat-associated protein